MNVRVKRLAILCGIADYGRPFGKLLSVNTDIEQLAQVLRTGLHPDFRYNEVRVFLNDQLTDIHLDNILEELRQDAPIDELLFYLAGHGCVYGDHHYFVTYGAQTVRPGMRLDELAEALQAVYPPRTLAILDFCHAGALPEALSPINNVSIDGTERLAVLAATRADERAVAGSATQKSFTQYFIQALHGAPPDDKGIIRWGNVGMFVCSAMERDSGQRPVDRGEYIRTHPINRVKVQRSVSHVVIPTREDPQPERRQGIVIAVKIANYQTLSERLDVEDLDQVLHIYHQACRNGIDEFEGHVISQNSHELLAYFGYPRSHEDDAFRAVRAGMRILDDLVEINKELQTRVHNFSEQSISLTISVHSGLVMLTVREERNCVTGGQTLTFVSQLNSLAQAGTLVISSDIYKQVKGGFTCLSLGPVVVEGLSTKLEVYQVIAENECQSRFDYRRTIGLTPLVGRKLEIEWLIECLNRVREAQGEVAQVDGVAGIGKSRLIFEFKLLLEHESHTLLECQCWEDSETTPFGMIIEWLEHFLGFEPMDTAEQKLLKLEWGLTRYGFDLTKTVPMFAMLLSLQRTRHYDVILRKTAKQRRDTIEALLSLFFKIAEKKPLIVIVEDLHWADPSTLELLDLFVQRSAGYHVLSLFTFRPEFRPPWRDRPYRITHMHLERLTSDQARSMVISIAGNKHLSNKITQQLVSNTDGVPLFIEEWTRALMDSGVLRKRRSSDRHSGKPRRLEIPTTLQELLMVRLDRLGSAKEVAQLGAVIGRQFSYELIHQISLFSERVLRSGIDKLVAADLIHSRGIPPKHQYVFKHSLIKDSAYNSLPRRRRIQLHNSVAQNLRDYFPELAARQPEILAHHYSAANLREEAVDYWYRAGNKALDRFALAESIDHFNRALETLQMLEGSIYRDTQELSIRLSLGTALSSKCYASPEVERCYSQALELCTQLSDFTQEFPVLRGLWCCYTGQARFQPAREIANQLLKIAIKEENAAHLVEANRTVGVIQLWSGELASARNYLERGSALYAQQAARSNALVYGIDPGAVCLIYTAWILLFMGYPKQAYIKGQEALALAGETNHFFTQAFMYTFAACLSQFSGDFVGTFEMATQAINRSSEFGFNQWLAWGHILQGWALAKQGNEEGFAKIELGWREALTYSVAHGSSAFLSLHAEAYACFGEHKRGLEKLDEALKFVAERGEHFYEAELYRLRGELLLSDASGQEDEAERQLENAIEIATQQRAKLFELRALTSLARLQLRNKESKTALARLKNTYQWFTEGFETHDLIEAGKLIKRMT